MNVLSLFDGMSGGQLALDRLGFAVENYFASEIDKHAIAVAKHNFPSMQHVGSVTELDTFPLPHIDLLMGGSPCQNFSFSGNRKGMSTKDNIEILTLDHYLDLKTAGFEFNGQTYLFWEFVRVLKEVNPRYFLLENVMMAKKWEAVITDILGVEPLRINSSKVSAQSRDRLYWTNIPVDELDDKGIPLSSVLGDGEILVHNIYGGFKEKVARTFVDKSPTLRANSGGGSIPSVYKGSVDEVKAMELPELRKVIRKLAVSECEALQTVPIGYTEVDGVPNGQKYKMLGNGWTIDVIAHILKNIK
jgi:DNA (cytosine-5)-methyltransferase 3A